MIEELAKVLQKHLKLSEEDALVAAICAVSGFSIDSIFFAGGIPTPTVTVLSGVGGLAASKLLRNRPFYQNFLFKRIDKLVYKGHITKEKAMELKERLVEKWAHDTLGLRDNNRRKKPKRWRGD